MTKNLSSPLKIHYDAIKPPNQVICMGLSRALEDRDKALWRRKPLPAKLKTLPVCIQ